MTRPFEPGDAPRAVLVDLDGPLTRLFPDPRHFELAARLAQQLPTHSESPSSEAHDHIEILRYAAENHPDRVSSLESIAAEAELSAAATAKPAAGAGAFLRAAKDAGYAVAVVSNNADPAVRLALKTCGLADLVDEVSARAGTALFRLKPAPDLILDAMGALGVAAAHCTFYGDTVSDVIAGQRAGLRVVGVTHDLKRTTQLLAEGAVGVVHNLGEAVDLLPPDVQATHLPAKGMSP